MKETKRIAAAIAVCAGLLVVPASAAAAPSTWGQEVKECNATSCYPGGSNRGGYVRVEAQDSETPGYAREVQDLALNPRGIGNGGF
jgi:hypothetical protein